MLLRILALSLAVSNLAAAYAQVRAEFEARVDGRRMPGAQVCFFQGSSDETPLDLWLSSAEARCLSADDVIEIPLGVWNFWIQHEDGWRTPYVSRIINKGMRGSPYKLLTHRLSPAESITIPAHLQKLSQGETLFAYVPSSEGAPAIYPLPRDATAFLAPRGGRHLFIRRSGNRSFEVLTAAGKPLSTTPSKTVIVWTELSKASRQSPEAVYAMQPPHLVLERRDGKRFEPFSAIARAEFTDFHVAVFPNIPPGEYAVIAGGNGWAAIDIKVTVPSSTERDAVVAEQSVVLDFAARLHVRWNFPPELFRSGECDNSTKQRPRLEIALCETPRRCKAVRMLPIDSEAGEVDLGDLVAGNYRIRGGREPNFSEASVTLVRGAQAQTSLQYRGVLVSGVVRSDDQPVPRARVSMERSSAITDDHGEYRLLMPAQHVDHIVIRGCDRDLSYQDWFNERLESDARIDIEIPATRVRVVVRDEHGSPIDGATIQIASTMPEETEGALFFSDAKRTSSSGEAVFENVNRKYAFAACAEAVGFKRKCSPRQKLTKEADVILQLTRAVGREGRVVSAVPVEWGKLFWADETGRVSDVTKVNDDGTFIAPDVLPTVTHVVLVSRNLPLLVVHRQSADFREALEIVINPSVTPSFVVRTTTPGPTESRFVVLFVDDFPIPLPALTFHQSVRGQQASFSTRNTTIRILQIGASRVSAAVVSSLVAGDDIERWLAQPGVLGSLRVQPLSRHAPTELVP